MHQLITITSLRPARQPHHAKIRRHRIKETDIIVLYTRRRKPESNAVRSENIRRMEYSENRSAVIVRCQVGP
jgi:hypothetical protein